MGYCPLAHSKYNCIYIKRCFASRCSLMPAHKEPVMAAKLRHIAIAVKNPETAAQFFEKAFGMTRAGNAMRGIYLTDGVMNVALLNFGEEPVPGFETQKDYEGIIHFGMWVDNTDEADMRIKEAGGSYMTGRFEKDPSVFYEVKYKTPEGIVFDITANGWKGAIKDVVSVETTRAQRS
jgi:predicted enzyme related to lactoylglutathione lyase